MSSSRSFTAPREKEETDRSSSSSPGCIPSMSAAKSVVSSSFTFSSSAAMASSSKPSKGTASISSSSRLSSSVMENSGPGVSASPKSDPGSESSSPSLRWAALAISTSSIIPSSLRSSCALDCSASSFSFSASTSASSSAARSTSSAARSLLCSSPASPLILKGRWDFPSTRAALSDHSPKSSGLRAPSSPRLGRVSNWSYVSAVRMMLSLALNVLGRTPPSLAAVPPTAGGGTQSAGCTRTLSTMSVVSPSMPLM
mmetsp:Transcript_63034/g.186194  ORF Transcript_63034/g.186194 Transcript_63034/m.186194 type:complete len:256 (-) Transcript_63034:586-1353(-)